MVREKARREGERKVLLTMCRSDMIVEGKREERIVFEFVEEFLVSFVNRVTRICFLLASCEI